MNSDVTKLEADLNALIQRGDIMAAFVNYYADDVATQENIEPPYPGKIANRARERAFFESVGQFHDIELVNSAAKSEIAFPECLMDVTIRTDQRVHMAEVSVRRRQDGGFTHERFYDTMADSQEPAHGH